ncbi:HmuY family protein [Bacteroidota bacterium]
MRKENISILLILIMLLSSCFKEDEKVMPHDPGNLTTKTVSISNQDYPYLYQVYYSLSNDAVVSQNLKGEWDLGFDCSESGWRIILNSSCFMYAANTGDKDISLSTDTTGLTWKFDKSDGNPDSNAIGRWFEYNTVDSSLVYPAEVYVFNRGYNEKGKLRGLKKVVFDSLSQNVYYLRFADIDGSNITSVTISKEDHVNYTFLNFDNGGQQLTLEPNKQDWDLLFTQYTTLLFTDDGQPKDYLLTGVLLNPYNTKAMQDSSINFFNVDYSVATGFNLTNDLDVIGYDWKDIVGDVNSGQVTYVIIPNLYYVIQDKMGFYYKLRFISFYNNAGLRGCPTFEFQKL